MMAHKGLTGGSVQALKNKHCIQSVPVPHVKVRKGGSSEDQKIMFAVLPLPTFFRK